MSAHLQAQPGAQRLIQYVLLVAKTAAHIGLDDPHAAPVDAQRLPHHAPHDVGDLRGGHHLHPVALQLGKADEVLDVTVLHHRRLVPAFNLYEPRLPDGLLIVAQADLGVLQDVVGKVFMQLGRAFLHGLLNVQHKGVFLVLHFDLLQSLGRGHLVLGHHGGDIVSVEAHPVRQYEPVCHVLVGRVRGPGMPRRGIIVLFLEIEAGQYLHHARHPLSLGGVDGHDPSVGYGRMQQPGDIGPSVAQVVGIPGAPSDLVKGIHALNALSRIHKPSLLLF